MCTNFCGDIDIQQKPTENEHLMLYVCSMVVDCCSLVKLSSSAFKKNVCFQFDRPTPYSLFYENAIFSVKTPVSNMCIFHVCRFFSIYFRHNYKQYRCSQFLLSPTLIFFLCWPGRQLQYVAVSLKVPWFVHSHAQSLFPSVHLDI